MSCGPFSEGLRRLLKRRRVTQYELAGRAGVSRSKVSEYVAGRVHPQADTIRRMLEALQASWADLDEPPVPREANLEAMRLRMRHLEERLEQIERGGPGQKAAPWATSRGGRGKARLQW